jgi:hypothetical protein
MQEFATPPLEKGVIQSGVQGRTRETVLWLAVGWCILRQPTALFHWINNPVRVGIPSREKGN